jgi:broad specificity phosphatase PhoE
VTEPRSLLLLRHGRTAWNLERRIQGQLDAGLDDAGRAQAEAAAKRLADHDPAVLWSSDLSRAADTAAYVGAAAGLPVVTDDRLREFHLGSMQGRSYPELAETHPAELERIRRGDFEAADGESTPEVGARMAAALGELLQATPPGRLAIAVSHGAAIRVGIGSVLGWGATVGLTLGALGNCCWAVLTENEADGALRLTSYNRDAGER